MRLKSGGLRELHWHKQAEWSFMLAGNARITAVDNDGLNFVADVGPGDLWYFPAGIPHSIQGLPDEGCEFLAGVSRWRIFRRQHLCDLGPACSYPQGRFGEELVRPGRSARANSQGRAFYLPG